MTVRLRYVLVIIVLLAFAGCGGLYFAIRSLGEGLPVRLTRACTVTADGTVTLEPDQMANAATIAAVGLQRGLPDQAVVVALATAFQESKLQNLVGGDRDSIGLFQQRPSQGWGTPEQIGDPRYAAIAFYNALLKVPGWQQMRVTDAAQAVQKSAHPELYEKWADSARILTSALTGTTTGAVACSLGKEPTQRGDAASQALTEALSLDWARVRTAPNADPVGVTLDAADDRNAWRYAHWLVAHAHEIGIKRVRLGEQEWSRESGAWSKRTGTPPATRKVVADLYA